MKKNGFRGLLSLIFVESGAFSMAAWGWLIAAFCKLLQICKVPHLAEIYWQMALPLILTGTLIHCCQVFFTDWDETSLKLKSFRWRVQDNVKFVKTYFESLSIARKLFNAGWAWSSASYLLGNVFHKNLFQVMMYGVLMMIFSVVVALHD